VSQRLLLAGLRVLVVDDEEDVRRGIERLVRSTGASTDGAESGEAALAWLHREPADLVVSDIRMPGISGMELLREVRSRRPHVQVVMITGFGTIETAVTCLQAGAAHFLTKPFDNAHLVEIVQRVGLQALAARRAREAGRSSDRPIVAVDPRSTEVLAQVDRIAPLRVPVLLEGRSGTGKEVVARALHERGAHPERPFLAVNCAALPDTLLESELFGHKRGAFTGAHRDHQGLFAQAAGGTVFLDEIPSMSLPFQGKLLRVLEDRRVRPLGSVKDEAVDFRLIAATNRDLPTLIGKGAFREDLYYRLRVMTIRLPDLRERPGDIPALAQLFVERAARDLLAAGTPPPTLSPAALEEMLAHPWPGNARAREHAPARRGRGAGRHDPPHHLRLDAREGRRRGRPPTLLRRGQAARDPALPAALRARRARALGRQRHAGCGGVRHDAPRPAILKDLGWIDPSSRRRATGQASTVPAAQE
jgi:DNA-binding NtrC family response regulator